MQLRQKRERFAVARLRPGMLLNHWDEGLTLRQSGN